jgi:predicted RNA-binding protein with PIN domain
MYLYFVRNRMQNTRKKKAVAVVDSFICASLERRCHKHYCSVNYFMTLSTARIFNGRMINELEGIRKEAALV